MGRTGNEERAGRKATEREYVPAKPGSKNYRQPMPPEGEPFGVEDLPEYLDDEAAVEFLEGCHEVELWLYPYGGGYVVNGYFQDKKGGHWLSYPDCYTPEGSPLASE